MTGDGNVEQEHIQIPKESYLSKLSPVDRENLEIITQLFEIYMRENNRGGSLFAVGGTLTKPLPRPDIDLIIVFEDNPSYPLKKDYDNSYSYVQADFALLQEVITKIIDKDSLFKIDLVQEPEEDREYGVGISFEGSIKVSTPGTPLEFIRFDTRGSSQLMEEKQKSARRKRPFVLLTEVKPSEDNN